MWTLDSNLFGRFYTEEENYENLYLENDDQQFKFGRLYTEDEENENFYLANDDQNIVNDDLEANDDLENNWNDDQLKENSKEMHAN